MDGSLNLGSTVVAAWSEPTLRIRFALANSIVLPCERMPIAPVTQIMQSSDQLLVWILTASRGRLLTGSGDASVLTSMALPSCRAICRA